MLTISGWGLLFENWINVRLHEPQPGSAVYMTTVCTFQHLTGGQHVWLTNILWIYIFGDGCLVLMSVQAFLSIHLVFTSSVFKNHSEHKHNTACIVLTDGR